MIFDEVFKSLPERGWLTYEEAELLWQLGTEATGDILEIGTYCGRSAKILANAMPVTSTLYCCDPIIEGFDDQKTPSRGEILGSLAGHLLSGPISLRVHLCCMTETSLRAIWDTNHKLSLVYVDGDHSRAGTSSAIQHWAPLTKTIAFHDYGGSHFGVAEAINRYGFKDDPKVVGRIAVMKGKVA